MAQNDATREGLLKNDGPRSNSPMRWSNAKRDNKIGFMRKYDLLLTPEAGRAPFEWVFKGQP